MNFAETQLEVRNRHGGVIYATVTWPTSESSPLLILLHGFKGFRNWGFFPTAAQHFASAGMIVVRMDFSLNGMRGTANHVVSTDDFAANTITREMEDVDDLLHVLRTSDQMTRAWNGHLNIIGHSRGGGIAMLAGAAHHAQKVVGWNSVGRWGRWTPRQRDQWLREGTVEVENTRTGQKLAMNSTFVEDIETHTTEQSLLQACRTLSDRLLFIHAEQDLTVPLREIQALVAEADRATQLIVVPNTTHTFNVSHPFEGVTTAFSKVLEHTTNFLHQ